jgi:hypothetical protein
VSWVRSLEPMEKPSKYSRNSAARMALLGTSHIMMSLSSFSPRLRPFGGQQLGHALGLLERAHEGHHDLHVGQAHVVAHALERLALHREGFANSPLM